MSSDPRRPDRLLDALKQFHAADDRRYEAMRRLRQLVADQEPVALVSARARLTCMLAADVCADKRTLR